MAICPRAGFEDLGSEVGNKNLADYRSTSVATRASSRMPRDPWGQRIPQSLFEPISSAGLRRDEEFKDQSWLGTHLH